MSALDDFEQVENDDGKSDPKHEVDEIVAHDSYEFPLECPQNNPHHVILIQIPLAAFASDRFEIYFAHLFKKKGGSVFRSNGLQIVGREGLYIFWQIVDLLFDMLQVLKSLVKACFSRIPFAVGFEVIFLFFIRIFHLVKLLIEKVHRSVLY